MISQSLLTLNKDQNYANSPMKCLKYLFIVNVFCLMILLPCVASARSLQLGIYSLPYPYQTPTQISWLKNNFDIIAGVNTITTEMTRETIASFTGYGWMKYHDIAVLDSFASYLKLVDYANSVGIISEEMLLHGKLNFTYSRGTAWLGADKFDAFENANGVLLHSGSTYTDKTAVAYSGASPYTTINQDLYIGYELPFDKASIDIRTAAASLVGTWQYWNGTSWATLIVTDGTSDMTVDGTLSFVPPATWARTIVNGSRNKYFIRFDYTSADTAPVINTIKGDPWYADGMASHVRGWDATDANIINSGELAYNPTPPAGASAKFRYYSRIPAWSSNHFFYNFADYQSIGGISTRTTSAYLANTFLGFIDDYGWEGIMCDDGTAAVSVSGTGIDYTNTDFVDKADGKDWTTVEVAKYNDLTTMLHSANQALKIGVNSNKRAMFNAGDWNLVEYFNHSYSTGDSDNTLLTVASGDIYQKLTYDYLLSGTKKAFMIYDDPYSVLNTSSGTLAFWDQASRGTMTTLSKHLIGFNSNTYYGYISTPNAMYPWIDDVLYLNPSKGTVLTQPVAVDISTATKYIYVADAAQFPAKNIEAKIDGANPELISYSNATFTKVNNTTLSTTAKIYFSHNAGDVIRFAEPVHVSDGLVIPISDVYRYTTYFPAMSVDFGTPTSERNMTWVTGVSQGWPQLTAAGNNATDRAINTNVWRRDFTNCIVLHRPNGGSTSHVNFNEYSGPLDLGGTYYRLSADGTTGGAITSIKLRRGEGAILMKNPIQSNTVVSPPTPPTAPPTPPDAPKNVIKK